MWRPNLSVPRMKSKAHIIIMREQCHAEYHPVNCLNAANVNLSLGRKGGSLSSTKPTRKSSGSLGRGHSNGMRVGCFLSHMYLQSTGDGTLDIDEVGSTHALPPRFLHFIIRGFPVQNNTLLPQKSRKPEKSAVSSPAKKEFPQSSYSRVRKSGGIVFISSLELNSTRGSATSCEQL